MLNDEKGKRHRTPIHHIDHQKIGITTVPPHFRMISNIFCCWPGYVHLVSRPVKDLGARNGFPHQE
jgi:hypothetical protein